MAYIVKTGCAGYWGEEFHIMRRGAVVATALSLESAERKRDEINAN